MKAVKQQIHHRPEHGAYGDCVRACFASLFELPIDRVPHFANGNPAPDVFNQRVDDFLRPLGLAAVTLPMSGSLGEVMQALAATAPGVWWMLGGRTFGHTAHLVLGHGGTIVHDPAVEMHGFLRPGIDGCYWVAFLTPRYPWEYRAQEPRAQSLCDRILKFFR